VVRHLGPHRVAERRFVALAAAVRASGLHDHERAAVRRGARRSPAQCHEGVRAAVHADDDPLPRERCVGGRDENRAPGVVEHPVRRRADQRGQQRSVSSTTQDDEGGVRPEFQQAMRCALRNHIDVNRHPPMVETDPDAFDHRDRRLPAALPHRRDVQRHVVAVAPQRADVGHEVPRADDHELGAVQGGLTQRDAHGRLGSRRAVVTDHDLRHAVLLSTATTLLAAVPRRLGPKVPDRGDEGPWSLAAAGPSGETAVMTAPITVFLLDDHEVVRRGMCALLESEGDIRVVGEASTTAEALARVPALRPQVAVLDVRLPDGDGVTVCRELRSRLPDLACLMLTSYADDEALFGAIMAGASGYLLKQVRGDDILGAVRTVAAGGSLLDPRATARVLERLRAPAADADPLRILSEQERRILVLIGEGLTNRQIGERLFLAEKTVKNYVSSLLAKLGLQRRTQAAAMVVRLNG
jgi:DNA-binding NarL/FixJ family response regulator